MLLLIRHYNMKLDYFMANILPLKDKLYRFALCILHNREEAEDIVQDVMLKMWNSSIEIEKLQNSAAYCTVLTKNMAFDRLRRKDFNNNRLSPQMNEIAESDTPLHRMQENEQIQLVEHFIACLPTEKRMLIQLRDIEGQSYKQIAEILNLSESQVKTNLFRIRQEMKKWFEKINSHEKLH